MTEKSPGIVAVEGKEASLENLSLGGDDYFTLQLTFTPYADNPPEQRRMPDVYRFDVSETSATGDLIGGQRIALKTYAAAGANHHAPIP